MTQEKDSKQIAQEILSRSRTSENLKKVKNARIVLVVLGGLNVLVGAFYLFGQELELEGYSSLVVGAIFIGLFFLGTKFPLAALISGLSIFVLLHVLSAIVEPESIVKGIVLKIIFVVLLVRGIISVSKIPKIKEDDEELLDTF